MPTNKQGLFVGINVLSEIKLLKIKLKLTKDYENLCTKFLNNFNNSYRLPSVVR